MAQKYIDIDELEANGGPPPGAGINELGLTNDPDRTPRRGVIDRIFDFLDARADARRAKRGRTGSNGT